MASFNPFPTDANRFSRSYSEPIKRDILFKLSLRATVKLSLKVNWSMSDWTGTNALSPGQHRGDRSQWENSTFFHGQGSPIMKRLSKDGKPIGNNDGVRGWSSQSSFTSHLISRRLADKYMPQPCLMKLNRTNGDENYLSSEVVSIALTCFLNPPHLSLKYAIQFFLIDPPQNILHIFKNWSSSTTWIRSNFSLTAGNK
jgi:hypothetical protein